MNTITQFHPSGAVSAGTTYRAAVIPGADRPVEIRSFPMIAAGPGEVIMRTLLSEVCGTDVHIQDGHLDGAPYPIIPGHFSVGVVEEVNGDVRAVDGRPVRKGDVITFLDVHETCHKCWECQVAKTPTRCSSRKVYGVTHSSLEGPLGGWSDLVLLQKDVSIAHLPVALSPERFMAGGCAMPTAIHAVERGNVGLGDVVLIQGAGPVGICAALAAHACGARAILSDMQWVRLEAADRLGFETIDLAAKDAPPLSERLAELTDGRLADVTIEATGAPAAVVSGMDATRDGGCYVIVGHYSDAGETSINPHLQINRKHLDIRGTWGIEYLHFHKAIDLLARISPPSGRTNIEDVLTSTFSLDEAGLALQAVRERRVVKAIISLRKRGETS